MSAPNHEALKKIQSFDYDIAEAVEWVMVMQLGCNYGQTPGQAATTLLAHGHIELADALVKQGVVPETTERSQFRQPVGVMMALWDSYSSRESQHGPRKRSVLEILQYLQKHPDTWPVGMNEAPSSHDYYAPIFEAMSDRNFLPDRVAIVERMIAMGADINLQTPRWNIFARLIRNHRLEQFEPGRYRQRQAEDQRELLYKDIEQVVAWGGKIDLNPHVALAAAIQEDGLSENEGVGDGQSWGFCAQFVIDQGLRVCAPVNAAREVSPFAKAVETGQVGVVKELLAAGCDPAWIDPKTGDTLYAVAEARDYKARAIAAIPPELLKEVANHRNAKGEAPLHQAVAALSPVLVRHLLEAGADPMAINARGKTPLEAVKRTGPKAQKMLGEIMALMEKAGGQAAGDPATLLLQACRTGADDVVCRLLAQGADPNTRDRNGATGLMLAVQNAKDHNSLSDKKLAQLNDKHNRLINALLDAGADINAFDKKGDTALHWATQKLLVRVVDVLLNWGADPFQCNKEGVGAMHSYAQKMRGNGGWVIPPDLVKPLVEVYMQNGVDVFAKDAQGREAFDWVVDAYPEIRALRNEQILQATTAQASSMRSRRL